MQIEVIKLRELIPVRKVTGFVQGAAEPTIIIVGSDFSKAEKVYINHMESPSIQLVNVTTLHAVVPYGQESDLRSVAVVSYEFNRLAEQSIMEYQIGLKPKGVSGVLALTQLYVKWLMQTPGSDIQSPQRGGGLQRILGKLTTLDRMEPILSELSRAIGETTRQIQQAQVNSSNLPDDERLLVAELMDSHTDAETQTVSIFVNVVSFAGSSATASLNL
jgi:hypothetical protein